MNKFKTFTNKKLKKIEISKKKRINNYIKRRLGIKKGNKEYELVKERVLLKLNANKWEDLSSETLINSLLVIDESIRIIKLDRYTLNAHL